MHFTDSGLNQISMWFWIVTIAFEKCTSDLAQTG